MLKNEIIKQFFSWTPEIIGIIITGGLLSLLVARIFERNSERRKLFANAYKTALSWGEMTHRVKRRGKSEEEKRILVNRFHNLQEELNYFQGIIATESVFMSKSYKSFVRSIKKKNESLIKATWENPELKLPEELLISGNNRDEAEDFLRDVRHWLKWWQFPKILVIWRNR